MTDAAVLHGLPFLAIWGAYLTGFWPGLLSVDSVVSWDQMLSLRLDAYFSPVYTLTNWLITRLWLSPAVVAITQILSMAGACCLLLWACARYGASGWLRWSTAIWLAIAPATALLAITLWKDIPYSVAHLLVAALSIPIAHSRGEALKRPALALALIVSLVAIAVYRHNGLPVAIGYVLLLLLFARGTLRRRALAIGAATMIGIAMVQWSVTTAFHLAPIRTALLYQAPIHQVSAIIASGAPLDARERAVAEALMPLDEWKSRYICYQMLALITNGGLDWDALDRERAAFLQTWRRLVLRHPLTFLRHQACITSMIWRPDGHQVFAITGSDEGAVRYGVFNESRSPALRKQLTALYDWTLVAPLRWVVWGTAPHLWLMLGCVILVWRRRGFGWALLPFAAPLLHTAVLLVALPSPEFRLQFPVFLLGICSPLIASAALRDR